MLTTTGEPSGSTVELNWLPPLHRNGVIHYEIEYEPAMKPGGPVNAVTISSSSPYFTLTLPSEFQSYNVRVAAVNTKGRAKSTDLLVMFSGTERGICNVLHAVDYNMFHFMIDCCLLNACILYLWGLYPRSYSSDWCVRCCNE